MWTWKTVCLAASKTNPWTHTALPSPAYGMDSCTHLTRMVHCPLKMVQVCGRSSGAGRSLATNSRVRARSGKLPGGYNNNNNKSFISSQWTYTYIHTYFKSLRYNRKVHQHLEMLFIHHYTSSGKINQAKYCKCWQKHNTWSNINNETVNLGHIRRNSVHSAVHNQFAKL